MVARLCVVVWVCVGAFALKVVACCLTFRLLPLWFVGCCHLRSCVAVCRWENGGVQHAGVVTCKCVVCEGVMSL